MKLGILSDLHLSSSGFSHPESDADVICLLYTSDAADD